LNREWIKQYWFVIKELTGREVKRKYSRSYLGILWSVLNPLLSMTVMSVIFSTMFGRNIENYPIYYLTGSIFWTMFTNATNSAMTALVDNRNLLIKTKLPTEIFPLTRAFTALVNFGYSLIAYLIMLIVFRVQFSWYMLLILLYGIGMFFFSVGLGYLLSVLYVLFGDIKHLYSVLLTLWMYMTALFYPISSTPEFVQRVIRENPVYNYVSAARKCVLEAALPDTGEVIRMVFWAVGMYVFGKVMFRKMQSRILQKA